MKHFVQDKDDTHPVQSEHVNIRDSDSNSEEEMRDPLLAGPVLPAFVAAEARNFAFNLVGSLTTTKVPLNGLHDTDVETDSSVEDSVLSRSAAFIEDYCGVPTRPVPVDTSDFYLALGLWCDKEGITRRAYQGLIEVLRLIRELAKVHTIPCHLSTLQKNCRKRLPIHLLHKAVVAVKRAKQPSGLANSSQSSMYFFDMKSLVATELSTTKGRVFHTSMVDIVDNPSEYWHSRSWGSSIRTCSQN